MNSIVPAVPMLLVLALAFALAGFGGSAMADATATYKNPVFDHSFADPNLEWGHDGFLYAYSTTARWRELGQTTQHYFPIIRSKDMVHWEYVADVLPVRPTWKMGGYLWAPDVTYYKGKFYCYYAISSSKEGDAGIGLATADQAGGPFTDHGKVFFGHEIGTKGTIDPVLVIEDDKFYLFWGSFHGIFGCELSADGTKPVGEKFQIADNDFEGSYIFRRNGYYFYFGSVGTCCSGVASTYHLMMGRSKSLRGPYVDKDGKPLMNGGGTMLLHADSKGVFVGPGHDGDVITDDAGTDWLYYHAFHKDDVHRGRVFMMDRLDWVDGWPKIANDEDSTTEQPAPVIKNK